MECPDKSTDCGSYTTPNAAPPICCKHEHSANNFTGNKATIAGGAVFWNYIEPDNLMATCIFSENTGDFGAADVSGPANQINTVTEAEYAAGQLHSLARRLSAPVTTNQQSGGVIPNYYLVIQDKYGNTIYTMSSSTVTLTANKYIGTMAFSAKIEGSTQFISNKGFFNVSGVTFVGTPGTNSSISITSDAINTGIPSNNYANGFLMNWAVQLRDCIAGESLLESGKCSHCTTGTFSLAAPSAVSTCQKCPAGAHCYNGSYIVPLPGYWRSSNTSENFIECFRAASCLGGEEPNFSYTGRCETGYEGHLCAKCAPDYSESSSFKCSKCPDPVLNAIRIVGVLLAVILIIVVMVRSTLQSASEKKNYQSVFFRILMNHFQLVVLTASFKLSWPSLVTDLFSTAKPAAEASSQFISFDCFLDSRSAGSHAHNTVPLFFQKVFMFACLPFLIFAVSAVVWFFRFLKVRDLEYIKRRIVATIVILLFMVHPSIISIMFSCFNCFKVDENRRLVPDLSIVCYDSQHLFYAGVAALPAIVVWGLGIPMSVWAAMKKNKRAFNSVAIKEMYGFLYNGYRASTYFWEVVIMYRKIFIIFISVFLETYGAMSQALMVFMFLIVSLSMNMKYRPFLLPALNSLEDLSLVTSTVSIYAGLYFLGLSATLGEGMKVFLFFVILAANLFFLLFWIYHFLLQFKKRFRLKQPKVYLCLFLCGKKRRFDREMRKVQWEQKNETVVNVLEDLIDELRRFKSIYADGGIINDDKKFRLWLNKAY